MIAGINALVDLRQAVIQPVDLPLPPGKSIAADVLRIDKIHATISGNKWFKLKYSLDDAMSKQHHTIVTFGGAHSNHLVATAYACARLGLQSVGVVRGEQPAVLSAALSDCQKFGMQLHFVSREAYRSKETLVEELSKQYPNSYFIEEGGRSESGVKGAADILKLVPADRYSHICCAFGTGTMMAGLVNAAQPDQQIVGVSALKLPPGNDVEAFVAHSTGNKTNYTCWYNYHFGGYARLTPPLISFMNAFYAYAGVPLDIVYTAKLVYGIVDLAAKDHFAQGSRLLIIHSGGLQGNRSLRENTLIF